MGNCTNNAFVCAATKEYRVHYYTQSTMTFGRSFALPHCLGINMKASWRAGVFKSRKQADRCENFGETEGVLQINVLFLLLFRLEGIANIHQIST